MTSQHLNEYYMPNSSIELELLQQVPLKLKKGLIFQYSFPSLIIKFADTPATGPLKGKSKCSLQMLLLVLPRCMHAKLN